jgi:hypothetical protein
MSKVITKKELDLVIESTLEEAGLVSEESLCEGCGGTMVEGICEGGCGSIEEGEVDENFVLAADEAKDNGEEDFEYPKGSGKMHPVTIKTDIKVEESIGDANNKLLNEELKKFNKIINY